MVSFIKKTRSNALAVFELIVNLFFVCTLEYDHSFAFITAKTKWLLIDILNNSKSAISYRLCVSLTTVL